MGDNQSEPEARLYHFDVTAKYAPAHYKKGMEYVNEVRKIGEILNDSSWEVVYLEDYWLNATVH